MRHVVVLEDSNALEGGREYLGIISKTAPYRSTPEHTEAACDQSGILRLHGQPKNVEELWDRGVRNVEMLNSALHIIDAGYLYIDRSVGASHQDE